MKTRLVSILRYALNLLDPKKEIKQIRRDRSTENTYEAAYYMCYGADLYQVNMRQRQHGGMQWKMLLHDVDMDRVNDWNLGRAMVNVRQFETARLKLKEKVKHSRSY